MTEVAVKLGTGGRLVIPGDFREAMGLAPGDTVLLVLEPDGLRVLTAEQAVARAQALVRRYLAPGRDLALELIQQRREEADAP
ncbi:AbrB/MazE/SpoVT family DNA-binding domain-containing protein [Myxococcota bacterium]|jgi:AbrB family looped-hinge helix DNA binding protein|nr:AbrB/MazE/SpoVT family DNA-binding domain-containing protein [Myxococcota bacterium]